MKKWTTILGIFAALAMVSMGEEESRTWTARSGSTLEGSFVKQMGTTVVLKDASGAQKKISLMNLSPGDIAYIREIQTARVVAGGKGKADAQGALSEGLEKLIGNGKLKSADGKTIEPASLAGKKIGVYYSASWCGPCRQFTPVLKKAYEKMQADGKAFEIILVSFDQSSSSAKKYHDTMPWLMADLKSKTAEKLGALKATNGIPEFIILDAEGKVVSKNGRSDVLQFGADAYDRW